MFYITGEFSNWHAFLIILMWSTKTCWRVTRLFKIKICQDCLYWQWHSLWMCSDLNNILMYKRAFTWVLSLLNIINLMIEIVVDNTLDVVTSDIFAIIRENNGWPCLKCGPFLAQLNDSIAYTMLPVIFTKSNICKNYFHCTLQINISLRLFMCVYVV
jgi:hypothetical protein